MISFSETDIQQLTSKGISQEKVLGQIKTFEEGIPYINLEAPAVIGSGILKFTAAEEKSLVESFNKYRNDYKLLKFVPASGAASRMFKSLFEFMEFYDPANESADSSGTQKPNDAINTFSEGLEHFPFYDIVMARLAGNGAESKTDLLHFVREMLYPDKLQYDFYPKGLLPFHKYGEHPVTAFEEHLKEGAIYASSGKIARLHFTVSEQHEEMFLNEYKQIKIRLSEKTGVDFIVNFSQQKASTDTLAVTPDNEPFREANGSLLFRPGGHGALMENLNDQDADIIFIKNIDNVVVDSFADQIAFSKEVLAGLLIKLQQKTFEYAAQLDKNELDGEKLAEIQDFLISELNVRFGDNYGTFSLAEQIEILRDKINRPIRICGMVKNEGEPGGGPFWVKDLQANISLQIVESAQVDTNDPDQKQIFDGSTHFNPVDIVCGVRNYKGEKYNLLNFVDVKQGFISEKTKDGKQLKALELPGLWNGGMAYWNTVFVEVPLVTFNPVKTVNDLLKSQHQT